MLKKILARIFHQVKRQHQARMLSLDEILDTNLAAGQLVLGWEVGG